jgi:photosystem II stability/assembly factor-like uncharacterized protein
VETTKSVILFAAALLLGGLTTPGGTVDRGGQPKQKSYYAAVFLNRGHVSGSPTSNVGCFKRGPGDTSWTNIYHPNLLTFGMGIWQKGATLRRYLCMGNGLHRSEDGGRTWSVLTDWQTEEVLSVALDPRDSALIYIATPFGVFKSTDDGAHWVKKMQGMKKWFVKRLLLDHSDPNILFAGAEDDLYRSTDRGEHWAPLHVGVQSIEAVVQHPLDAKRLLVGTEDDGVRVTTDGGQTWRKGMGLPNTAFYGLCASSDGRAMYTGGYKTGFWKSDDGGLSWVLLWQGSDIEAIFTIFVHPDDPLHLMVGTSGQGIFESLDGGKTWLLAGMKGCHVKQIDLYP